MSTRKSGKPSSSNGPIVLESNPFFMICDKTAVSSLVDLQRPLITVQSHDTIATALHILETNHILSCPVLNNDRHCIGSIDLLSIIQYLDHMSTQSSTSSSLLSSARDHPVSNALITSVPLLPCYIDNPISILIDLLANNTRRVALYKKDYELIATVSQSDVIQFLSHIIQKLSHIPVERSLLRYKDDIEELCTMPLISFNLFHKPITVCDNTIMAKALEIMSHGSYRVLAVIDHITGHILGDISLSYLHNLHTDDLSILYTMTVYEWLSRYAPQGLQRPSLITSLTTYGDCLQLMCIKHTHHVFIVDHLDDNDNDIIIQQQQQQHTNNNNQSTTTTPATTTTTTTTAPPPPQDKQQEKQQHQSGVVSLWGKYTPTHIVTMTDLLRVINTAGKTNMTQVNDHIDITQLWKL